MRYATAVLLLGSIKPFSLTLVSVCSISGAFHLVESTQGINSAAQSNKVDSCVKSKQPVEGRATQTEIKKEKI